MPYVHVRHELALYGYLSHDLGGDTEMTSAPVESGEKWNVKRLVVANEGSGEVNCKLFVEADLPDILLVTGSCGGGDTRVFDINVPIYPTWQLRMVLTGLTEALYFWIPVIVYSPVSTV